MVSDMARARAFYEGRLGLEFVHEAGYYVFLRAGASQLALVARASVTPPASTLCAFEVDDLDRTVSRLRERGVVFEEYDFPGFKTVGGIANLPGERGAWFKDSEGNILAIGQFDKPI